MIKSILTFIILLLILSTALIKNSTKKIDDEIFSFKENIRELEKELENNKLEHNFLSSTQKLIDFQNLYFDDELSITNINDIKIIKIKSKKIEIEKLRFINE
jgi:cell division protein FtsL